MCQICAVVMDGHLNITEEHTLNLPDDGLLLNTWTCGQLRVLRTFWLGGCSHDSGYTEPGLTEIIQHAHKVISHQLL
jgi:hypothetical protein